MAGFENISTRKTIFDKMINGLEMEKVTMTIGSSRQSERDIYREKER